MFDDAVAVDGLQLLRRRKDALAEDNIPASAVVDAEYAPSYYTHVSSPHQSTVANCDEPKRNSWPDWPLWRHVLHFTMDCCSPHYLVGSYYFY